VRKARPSDYKNGGSVVYKQALAFRTLLRKVTESVVILFIGTMDRGRNWCFTLNNYTETDVTRITGLPYRYLIAGKEVGASGTPHIQGFIVFTSQRTFEQVRKLFLPMKPHIERAHGDIESNIRYCSKEGNMMEFGEKPKSAADKGALERKRWDDAYALAKAGDFAAIDTRILIPHIRNLQHLHYIDRSSKPLLTLDVLEHEWHYGVTGAGKSYGVRLANPVYYLKALNKWWDNYNFEEVVLIEEIDPSHANKFGAMMKVWCDCYPFRAEVKSSTMYIRPKKIIVTSNYSIKDVFPERSMHEPLLRRFKVHHYERPFDMFLERRNRLRQEREVALAILEDSQSDAASSSSAVTGLGILKEINNTP